MPRENKNQSGLDVSCKRAGKAITKRHTRVNMKTMSSRYSKRDEEQEEQDKMRTEHHSITPKRRAKGWCKMKIDHHSITPKLSYMPGLSNGTKVGHP